MSHFLLLALRQAPLALLAAYNCVNCCRLRRGRIYCFCPCSPNAQNRATAVVAILGICGAAPGSDNATGAQPTAIGTTQGSCGSQRRGARGEEQKLGPQRSLQPLEQLRAAGGANSAGRKARSRQCDLCAAYSHWNNWGRQGRGSQGQKQKMRHLRSLQPLEQLRAAGGAKGAGRRARSRKCDPCAA